MARVFIAHLLSDHQSEVFKRTCSTYVPQTTSIKDAQADLRLANAKTTPALLKSKPVVLGWGDPL